MTGEFFRKPQSLISEGHEKIIVNSGPVFAAPPYRQDESRPAGWDSCSRRSGRQGWHGGGPPSVLPEWNCKRWNGPGRSCPQGVPCRADRVRGIPQVLSASAALSVRFPPVSFPAAASPGPCASPFSLFFRPQTAPVTPGGRFRLSIRQEKCRQDKIKKEILRYENEFTYFCT